MSVLVMYASKHDSTKGIATRIAETLRHQGYTTLLRSVEEVGPTLETTAHEAVVIGSAVYYGSWLKQATEFVRRHHGALAGSAVWLFSSGPLGEEVKDDEPQPTEIAELREAVHPRDHRIFFGALDHSKLSFAERMVVKAIRAPEGDYRDWDEIEAWAKSIGRAISHIVAETSPVSV